MNSTNSEFLLSHHLGMGDHIVMNGLVRHIYEREQANLSTFWLLCYEHNARNVNRMYEDLPKLKLKTVKTFDEVWPLINSFQGKKEDFHLHGNEYEIHADDAFYLTRNYPVSLRKEFKIYRNKKAENKHFNALVKSRPYIFVHDDAERGYVIPEDKLPNLPKVRIPKDIPLFETLQIIEKAEECHVISSAFVCLLQSMSSLNKNVTVYTSIRNGYLKSYFERDGLKIA